MATKLVIEPIFETDIKECSYGFRPKRLHRTAIFTMMQPEIIVFVTERIRQRGTMKCLNKSPSKMISTQVLDNQESLYIYFQHINILTSLRCFS
jgi:hypothetical protein